jgi:4-hydroxybenzoate polyprenyltransferase
MLHVLMILCLLALVHSLHLGALALASVAAIVTPADLRAFLVRRDLSRVNAAFFTMNGYVGVLFLVFWAADIFFLKRVPGQHASGI